LEADVTMNAGTNPPDAPSQSPAGGAAPTAESDGRTIDAGRGRVFPCERCGAELMFNIDDQRLRCPHCGFEKEIAIPPNAAVAERDFQAMVEQLKQQAAARRDAEQQEETQNQVRCEGCGAEIVFVGTLTSTECPYCGCQVQREHVHTGGWRIPVDGMLAFVVNRERAAGNLHAWVRSRWFAPNEFRERGADGKFNGVYLPFWTYDALAACGYDGQRGEYYWETVKNGDREEQVRHTRWWPVSGSFQRFFDDILVPATAGIRRRLIDGLSPWPLKECRPFSQEVLAGFVSRTYDVELEKGFEVARSVIDAALEADVRQRIGGDEQQIDSIRTQLGAITFKHVLLPVWMLAYRYRDRTYQVLINACTGDVHGERPYSAWKIAFAVVFGMLSAAVIIYCAQQR
jgi:DNA-directed RNA polymerase subunit RPC12/RpoP